MNNIFKTLIPQEVIFLKMRNQILNYVLTSDKFPSVPMFPWSRLAAWEGKGVGVLEQMRTRVVVGWFLGSVAEAEVCRSAPKSESERVMWSDSDFWLVITERFELESEKWNADQKKILYT